MYVSQKSVFVLFIPHSSPSPHNSQYNMFGLRENDLPRASQSGLWLIRDCDLSFPLSNLIPVHAFVIIISGSTDATKWDVTKHFVVLKGAVLKCLPTPKKRIQTITNTQISCPCLVIIKVTYS